MDYLGLKATFNSATQDMLLCILFLSLAESTQDNRQLGNGNNMLIRNNFTLTPMVMWHKPDISMTNIKMETFPKPQKLSRVKRDNHIIWKYYICYAVYIELQRLCKGTKHCGNLQMKEYLRKLERIGYEGSKSCGTERDLEFLTSPCGSVFISFFIYSLQLKK